MPSVTVADLILNRLRDHGVQMIFGYPGGQLTPFYDALQRQKHVRHILARDEQAAAFMADGYQRATGQPGICLAVCGPGVLNAATPLATAFTDSIPILLISGQVPKIGLRTGYYHENEQARACVPLVKECVRLADEASIMLRVDQAFKAMTGGRPGPVLFEVGIDLLGRQVDPACLHTPGLLSEDPRRKRVAVEEAAPLAERLLRWQRPLILAGGGAIAAGAEALLGQLAQRLGAPVLHTLNGKCALPADHPLAAGLIWHRATSDVSSMDDCFSPLLSQADGLLAIGCRFTQASTGSWKMPLPKEVAQIDIDPAEIGRHYPVVAQVRADAKESLQSLLPLLPKENRQPWAKVPTREPWRLPGLDLVGPLRRVLPRDAIVVADITRLGYILLAEFPAYAPRSFLHPAGFVSMGYGIPAALGAKAAFPKRTVVAIEGDGCFQMCGMELATAVQEKLPIVIVLVNDCCLSLIKSTQERKFDKRFIGVDLVNPDFQKFAAAYGVKSWRVATDEGFEAALNEATASGEPALIEVMLGQPPAAAS
jgi:thiamine pyrophosphate-dependent acetolactate synthase large subunit-like protein